MKMLQMYFREDALVLSPTRSLKPISKVAENMSIVTAEEIEAMNAHTLTEVLERVTGVYIDYSTNDYFQNGSHYIQGSDINVDEKRVLVLLDSIPWNYISNGRPPTQSIPVGIIKRIEIVKGPASSSWGSSLGGVINIVTKDSGEKTVPSGSVSASYGERHSQDYNAELAGRTGAVGYYLHAGKQDSDGFRYNRYFEKDSLYGKFDILFAPSVKLLLTSGYINVNYNSMEDIDGDTTEPTLERAFFATATLSAALTDKLSVEASLFEIRQKFVLDLETLSTGDSLYISKRSEKKKGGGIKLTYMDHFHNAVLGWDISHGSLDQTDDYEGYGLGTFESQPGISKWAIFLNDTLSIGDLSVTPGIRYDENNISGDFTSPSLGATYRIGTKTLLRASVAKGFNVPPLSYTSGASYGYEPNPDLKPEKVVSYQAGAETLMFDYVKGRIALFQHNTKNEMQLDPTYTFHENKGKTRRTGMELDMETVPFYKVSVKAGVSCLRREFLEDESDNSVSRIYGYTISVKYDDLKALSAMISGNYTWWDITEDADYYNPAYKTMIWDLTIVQKIYSTDKFTSKIFLTAHNLFNGSYYTWDYVKNSRRWVEAGVKLEF